MAGPAPVSANLVDYSWLSAGRARGTFSVHHCSCDVVASSAERKFPGKEKFGGEPGLVGGTGQAEEAGWGEGEGGGQSPGAVCGWSGVLAARSSFTYVQFISFLLFGFGDAQTYSWLRARGSPLVDSGRPSGVPGIEPRSGTCKASPVLLSWLPGPLYVLSCIP